MNKESSAMQANHPRLPSLHKSTPKLIPKYESKVPQFIFSEKSKHQYQQHPKNINQVKAQNFLNQSSMLSSPSVIFNLSDCIKKQYGKKFDKSKQFSQENIPKLNISKNFQLQKQNQLNKSTLFRTLTESSFYQNQRKISFERQQVLNLAKWIDSKLQEFSLKKQITIEQIIDYKQHILNYGLGKLIDSVRKKSRQEGDLLKILWQNSFKIFQKVLQIVSNYICDKQQSYLNEQKQTKQIFDTNLNFLQTQNQRLNLQLSGIYEKMKKVIEWNKKLRKERKQLKVQNRILEYRNQTYSQALQQTIAMLLRTAPQPSTLSFSKTIIEKLVRQKRRKRKSAQLQQAEEDFKMEAKQMVLRWLRRNGFNKIQDQEINPLMYLTNEEKLELTKIDDENKINNIDIYDYFKLLDQEVQTDNLRKDSSCQYDLDNRPQTQSRCVMTDCLFKYNFQVQVSPKDFLPQNEPAIKRTSNIKAPAKIVRKVQKNKSNISKLTEKSDKVKQKSLSKKQRKQQQKQKERQKGDLKEIQQEEHFSFSKFSKAKPRAKQSFKAHFKTQEDKQPPSLNTKKNLSTKSIVIPSQKENKYNQENFTIISQKKTQEFSFESEQEVKNWSPSQYRDQYKVSISKLNDEMNKMDQKSLEKKQYYQTLKGREVSIKDFADPNFQDDTLGEQNYDNNLKKIWRQMHNQKIQKTEARNSRMSMNFIKIDSESYSMKKLQKKPFNQVYQKEHINSVSKEKQREKLFETVVRRRSFYKKGKVTFENSNDFQEMKENKSNIYKSYVHYKPRRKRTLNVIAQEEQKVDQITKMMAIPSNLAKSKTLQASKEMFRVISQMCKKTKKQPPKNKQYFNSSLISITKNVNALVQDYIRQIKREKDEIPNELQKSYYPLHTILIDKMNWKYGLKDISEKKIKDFLSKILTFAPVSEKVSLYSLLFGMETEGVGADQLLIYLKCLVYLQKKQPISSSIHILKETNIFQKLGTDLETVEENIDKILKQFFDQQGLKVAKDEIYSYIEQNPKIISIQKISEILIRCFLKRKQIFRKDCQFLYNLSNQGNNIFTNFYKLLKIYNDFNIKTKDDIRTSQKKKTNKIQKITKKINISLTLKEFIKRSDVVDEIYGKSISFDRFLTAFMVCQLPKSKQLSQIFDSIMSNFEQKYKQLNEINKLGKGLPKQSVKVYCQQNAKFLQDIQRSWQLKSIQRPNENSWEWNFTKTVADHVEQNLKSILGKLDIFNNQIENFFFSLENNSQSSLLNLKQ